MTYFNDLSPCDYFPVESREPLLAVGWLNREHDFCRGSVDRAFAAKLFELLRDPWQPCVFCGCHECEFCRFSEGPNSFQLRRQNDFVRVGCLNLFVPGEGCVFVAPSLIIHYIDSHGYCPPAVFQQAVLACPETRSMRYLRSLVSRGLKRAVNDWEIM